MPLAQDSAPGLVLWSLGLSALWSAALSAPSGEDRFGDRRIVLVHAGSIIPSTGIAGITPVDGIIINLTRNEARLVAANFAKLRSYFASAIS
jgi:hypothetical protein